MGLDFLKRYGAKRTVKASGSRGPYDIIDTESLQQQLDTLTRLDAQDIISSGKPQDQNRAREIVKVQKELKFRGVR